MRSFLGQLLYSQLFFLPNKSFHLLLTNSPVFSSCATIVALGDFLWSWSFRSPLLMSFYTESNMMKHLLLLHLRLPKALFTLYPSLHSLFLSILLISSGTTWFCVHAILRPATRMEQTVVVERSSVVNCFASRFWLDLSTYT